MLPRTVQLREITRASRCFRILYHPRKLLRVCIAGQTRSISLESLTTPFNRNELRAVSTGNPDLNSEYYLLYVGTLSRRISTYKIGAFLLSACGFVISPVVAATAEVPFMAIPVVIFAFLPLLGYHYLTRRYVLSMHMYIPPQARGDLRKFTSYVNAFRPGSILRFRTFRLLFGVKSHIVPVDELALVTVPGKIQAFEKNVEWVGPSWRSRTLFGGRKSWYIQPGLGGQEMDVFWRRLGVEENTIKQTREIAVAKMRKLAEEKEQKMREVVEKGPSMKGTRVAKRKVKKITLK